MGTQLGAGIVQGRQELTGAAAKTEMTVGSESSIQAESSSESSSGMSGHSDKEWIRYSALSSWVQSIWNVAYNSFDSNSK